MQYPRGLTAAQRRVFKNALRAPERQIRVRLRLYNRDNKPLGRQLHMLDGEVIMDCVRPKEQPTRTCHLTLIDPHRRNRVNLNAANRGLWFDKQIGVFYGVWVTDFPRTDGSTVNKWVWTPVFRGWVDGVNDRGIEVDIDLVGKERQHMQPYKFKQSITFLKSHRISNIIKSILRSRGEFRLQIPRIPTRLGSKKTWNTWSTSDPWKVLYWLLDRAPVNRHIYVRGTGVFRVRKLPQKPAWKFKSGEHNLVMGEAESAIAKEGVIDTVAIKGKRTVTRWVRTATRLASKANNGATSISVNNSKHFAVGKVMTIGRGDRARSRKITNITGGTTMHFNRALPHAFPKGARVSVKHRTSKVVLDGYRAKLPASHPLSDAYLTGGYRPAIETIDKGTLKKSDNIITLARNRRDHLKRIEYEHGIITIPIPGLEEEDLVSIRVSHINHRMRVKRFALPLTPERSMELNWMGRRKPKLRR